MAAQADEMFVIDSDHSPFLSYPERTAALVATLVDHWGEPRRADAPGGLRGEALLRGWGGCAGVAVRGRRRCAGGAPRA